MMMFGSCVLVFHLCLQLELNNKYEHWFICLCSVSFSLSFKVLITFSPSDDITYVFHKLHSSSHTINEPMDVDWGL